MSMFTEKRISLIWTTSILATVFLMFVYPWVGHVEGSILPVFENHHTYYSQVHTMTYIGGSLKSARSCDLQEVSVINVVQGKSEVLWSRSANAYPVRYSTGTTLGYGVVNFNYNFFGYKLGTLYVRTQSTCHPFFDTYNTYRIN